jgi:hypothetical protein
LGPQSRSGQRGEEKILDPIGTRTRPQSSILYPVAIPTELSRLLHVNNTSHYETGVVLANHVLNVVTFALHMYEVPIKELQVKLSLCLTN